MQKGFDQKSPDMKNCIQQNFDFAFSEFTFSLNLRYKSTICTERP